MSEPLKLTEIQSGHFLGFRPHPRRRQRHVGSQVRRRASAFADERSAHAATARRIDRPAAAARAILIWSRTRFRQPIASDMREPVVEVQGLVGEHLRGSFFSCELIGRPGHRVDHAHFGDDVPIQHQVRRRRCRRHRARQLRPDARANHLSLSRGVLSALIPHGELNST